MRLTQENDWLNHLSVSGTQFLLRMSAMLKVRGAIASALRRRGALVLRVLCAKGKILSYLERQEFSRGKEEELDKLRMERKEAHNTGLLGVHPSVYKCVGPKWTINDQNGPEVTKMDRK